MLCPPGWEHTETISNTGPYRRLQLDRDPNAWMYWVRPVELNADETCLQVDRRTTEVFQFQLSLTEKDLIPHHLKYGMVNPMFAESYMNEPTYCRIEMSHNEAQCTNCFKA